MNDKPNQYGPISLLLLVVIVAVVVYLAQVAPPSTDTIQAETPNGQSESGKGSPPDTSPKVKEGDIVCEISTEKTDYVVGDAPVIQVRLHNRTKNEVTLVGSLDASDLGWRYPHCVFEVKGPPGHEGPGLGRCGNTNPLRKKDFVRIAAGKKFDPFMRIDDYGFFGNSGLDFTRFQDPGKYQITFRYSTKNPSLQEWVGLEAPPAKDSEVAKLFGQVPKLETKSNTIELTFGPPPGGYVPGFKTPLSRAKSMGAHFLRLTLGQRPIHPPQMDVVWMVDGIPDDVSLHTDLSFVDGYLASVLPVVLNAGGRWTHHVVTLGSDGEPETVASWPATRMTEEAARTVSKLKARPAASPKELLTALAGVLKSHTLDPKDKEPSVVVFVLTEKPFEADDVKPLVPAGSDPPGVFRVTRQEGTWIPEKLIGHVRRPQKRRSQFELPDSTCPRTMVEVIGNFRALAMLNSLCTPSEHLSRRTLLKGSLATATGATVLNWGGLVNFAQAADAAKKEQKHCILLWMNGGVSQFETFDMKPGRPTGGVFRPISTCLPGTQICELMPNMAQHLDKVSVIRSMRTSQVDHPGGIYLMHTGYQPTPNVRFPEIGAIAAKYLGGGGSGLPEFIKVSSQGNAGSGFLGPQYQPFSLNADGRLPPFSSARLSGEAEKRQHELISFVEDQFAKRNPSENSKVHREAYEAARRLESARKAFDIDEEWPKYRELYGDSGFGRRAMLARKMVEKGVPFIEIGQSGYDTHADNFMGHKGLVPPMEKAWSGLLVDLQQRGLLEKTLVIWMGEIGRTPRVNNRSGRDHYVRSWSTALAGCGIKGGFVYGATDEDGLDVKENKVTEGDFFATIYKALGVDPETENYAGVRPIPLTPFGSKVVEDLLA